MAGTALREILARFGIEVDTKQLDKGNSKVDDFTKRLEKFGQVLAGAFVLTKATHFVKQIFEEGNALYLASRRAGMTAEAYQGLEHTTEMLNVSTQNLGVGIKYLHRNLALAANGNQKLKKTFETLGVAIEKGVPNDAEEAFRTIADGISSLGDENLQTAMAMKVFGRSGALLLPVLKAGSSTIKEYSDEVKALGGGFTNSMADMVDSLDDQVVRQQMALRSVRAAILDTLIPALKVLTDGVTAAAKGFLLLNKHGEAARFVIVGTLLAIAAACAPFAVAMMALALPLAKILLLASAIEDLYVLLRGGKSLSGQLGNKISSDFSTTAKLVGDSIGLMSTSWSNFMTGIAAANLFIGFSIGAVWNDLYLGFSIICGKLDDRWNEFVFNFTRKLHLPEWVNKILRVGNYEADAASGKSHEQQARDNKAVVEKNWFDSFTNDPAIQNYRAAMQVLTQSEQLSQQNDKKLAMVGKYGGTASDYNRDAFGRQTQGQKRLVADEQRRGQVDNLASRFGGNPADYWKNQGQASSGLIEELRRVASGPDKAKAKLATKTLDEGRDRRLTNKDAYKVIAPEMVPKQDRPRGFVEQPFQSKFFDPANSPLQDALKGPQPTKPVQETTNNNTKTFTDNSTKTLNITVPNDKKEALKRLAKEIANEGLRGKMDREFEDPNFESEE